MKITKKYYSTIAVLSPILLFFLLSPARGQSLSQRLSETAPAYVKYFLDRSLDQTSGFYGLTRSFQLYLGNHTPEEQALINYGAASYDHSILARINLVSGNTAILDTYVYYFKEKLSDPNNPLFNCNGNYYDANNTPLRYGLYRIVRILGRNNPYWWETWDWIVDTGATACLIIDALDAYQQTHNQDYKNLAVLLGDYVLRLQDSDGGIRYGPRGMYHDPEPRSDFYWNLKSTEQNERALFAFEALYQVTLDNRYNQAATKVKSWLKDMYDTSVHLYHSAATFNGTGWVKLDFGYVATDVVALAPLEMMYEDAYFGSTQEQRNAEIDAMFAAMESRTAFLNSLGQPVFFRFSISQTGDYGSVEVSAQMALAYLMAAQIFSNGSYQPKAQGYLDKYNTLVYSLERFFTAPTDDLQARVAPYASYLDGRVAGGVPTGTGYYTYNCQAALASSFFAFAKAGYLPYKLGGGSGIPNASYLLNMVEMPWYQNTAYNSTGAACAQMILNYIREGAQATLLDQAAIYEYARSPYSFGVDLNPDEMDKALGHFDPYDTIVSNSFDRYDSFADGNPFQGYNYTVDAYDPALNPDAFNEYLRDICHWMAFTVTKEEWWKDQELVAHPNTPAAVPVYGTYNHWVAVKGYATSANPCPAPRINPSDTPDFTVYGLWVKDPLTNGIGKDTYKTADECRSTYFLPIISTDAYNGKFIQIAEPPAERSRSHIKLRNPQKDLANLEFIGAENGLMRINRSYIKKKGWQDIVDGYLLSDVSAVTAFEGTRAGKPILVRRMDRKNADYYLVPFGKHDNKGIFLVSGVIILDANDGHFKEASWTEKPERFLKVDRNQAIRLVQKYILEDFSAKLRKLRQDPRRYSLQITDFYSDYSRLLRYLNLAKTQLLWQPTSESPCPYRPYWRVDANGYAWIVTQEGKIIPEAQLGRIIHEIKTNRIYLRQNLFWAK